jgi:X-X-X-Leu-X-X-Gly heptad repeat protein
MNKTLLLILCDFLLLNLLALTRWEKAEPVPTKQQPPVPEMSANAATRDQDLVETMRQSLADEKAARDQLTERLTSTDSTLAAREQALASLQTERNKLATERASLATSLTETQKTAAELNQRVATATQEATMTKEQLAQLQRELADRQAEAERQKQALATLEKQHAEARKQIEGLTTAVAVAEQEKKSLRDTAEVLKTQVEVERADRIKVQETTTQLAQGVGQLAEKSGELTKEIRDNRPINANTLFNDFLANSVQTTFNANRRGLLHQVQRTAANRTVFVTDGKQIYALMHISDTPFAISTPGTDWEKVSVELARTGGSRSVASIIQFLAIDPRVVVLPVTAEQVSTLGGKVYPLAAEPFKFPEAVLISGGGKGYGEVGFKLDISQPGYVRVDNRFFKRLFGDFSPSAGDLVFSKTGELLGIMVNSDYCAVMGNFAPSQTIRAGDDVKSQNTARIFETLDNRYRSLPAKMQSLLPPVNFPRF